MTFEPLLLPRDQQRRLTSAVRRAYPREACGLLFAPPGRPVELRLVPTAPTWNTPASFRIKAREIERSRREREALGESLVGCFHSHVISGARPSRSDRLGAKRLGGLWLIYSVRWHQLALFHWDGTDFERRPLALP